MPETGTSKLLRLVFMGSPDFSVPCLLSLREAGHEIAAVYAQPPRPAGRGHRETPCPVHQFALDNGLAARTPKNFRDPADVEDLAALAPDAIIVVAYGLILPKSVLAIPRLGCINVHASLLPRWRGAAPIQRAIEAGDTETGVTIMMMDEGLDTGDMLIREKTPITAETTGGDLHDTLSAMGGPLLVKALDQYAAGTLQPTPQPDQGITYAQKLSREEARLDWTLPADQLERRIRAFTPWPGSWFQHGKERIKLLTAETAEGAGQPGTVLDDQLTIACGTGALKLTRLQRPGKSPMAADDLLRGYQIPKGTVLG